MSQSKEMLKTRKKKKVDLDQDLYLAMLLALLSETLENQLDQSSASVLKMKKKKINLKQKLKHKLIRPQKIKNNNYLLLINQKIVLSHNHRSLKSYQITLLWCNQKKNPRKMIRKNKNNLKKPQVSLVRLTHQGVDLASLEEIKLELRLFSVQ